MQERGALQLDILPVQPRRWYSCSDSSDSMLCQDLKRCGFTRAKMSAASPVLRPASRTAALPRKSRAHLWFISCTRSCCKPTSVPMAAGPHASSDIACTAQQICSAPRQLQRGKKEICALLIGAGKFLEIRDNNASVKCDAMNEPEPAACISLPRLLSAHMMHTAKAEHLPHLKYV